ncbi:hypothetical protein OROHE_014902 [Orobanche hederae]
MRSCHCNKLKSQFEYSELSKLEALDFKAVMESISTHLLEAWKSSDSDSEHLMYLIYYFSLKSDHYLYDRVYIFSAEKLEAMFRLFEVLVKCQDLGMRVLNNDVEDKLLTESDLHMHLTSIYSIMSNELFRSDKEWLGALLCLITKWAHALLKKAKSSHIGSNVASLCCSTLAFLMDSPFNDNESFFRTAKKMCTSLLKRENNREFVIDILKSIWHSCDDGTTIFCQVTLYCAWKCRDTHFSQQLANHLRSVAQQMKDMTLPNSILKLCLVGLGFSSRGSFEKLLQTLEDNMVLLETVSSSRASMSMTVQDKNSHRCIAFCVFTFV